MGFHLPSSVLISLLLVAMSPSALGRDIAEKTTDDLPISLLNVTGILVCSPDGNPVAGTSPVPVAGALVLLQCSGANTTIGQVLTDPLGVYSITIQLLDTLLFDTSNCRIRINLPILSCSLFPPTGALQAGLTIVNVVRTLLSLVINVVPLPLVHVLG